MNQCFEPSRITSVIELNFKRNNSKQRWRRVKEYFQLVQDDHWQKDLRDIKAIMNHSRIY